MLKQPKEVIRHFLKCLKEEKELKFDMDYWFHVGDTDPYYPCDVKNVCGTSACLAGTVAYRLDPSAEQEPEKIVRNWVGLGGLYVDFGDEKKHCHNTLHYLFREPEIYREKYLCNVTKEQVIDLLEDLADLDTWEQVAYEVTD
tara:strand:+ start:190 stop:618 length:429 start_codon:yes stop_codon:yes gene_type:complete